ncbi:MAG: hypothetical protein ACRDWW_01870, partial [Acidimicrobiales bacterium]
DAPSCDWTLWFVDASVLLASEEADDGNHASARQLLTGTDPVATLDLAFYEVTNVAAARLWGAQLVSCDVRDLVSAGLAPLPRDVPPAGDCA